MGSTISNPRKLVVALKSSGSLAIHYFDTVAIELNVTNISAETLLIESATLRFDPDTGAVPIYVDAATGLRLTSKESGIITVAVRPVPLFRESTNQFTARFKCHCESGGRLGNSFTEPHEGFYIIINSPTTNLGNIFVSFKQPEDQRLANILERYAKRAGFTPHLFMRNPNLGADQWKVIEKLIKGSHSTFIVWALRTDWGGGVEKEIELCRKHKIREVLLIEEGVELPDLYKGTNSTYKRFDPSDPAKALSEAISWLHDEIAKK